MRKSNFFNFVIALYDSANHPVEVHRAVFKDFYDTTAVRKISVITFLVEITLFLSFQNGQEYRNGLIYKLTVMYSDGELL